MPGGALGDEMGRGGARDGARAGEDRGGARGAAKTGSVAVVQRTSSDLRLNPHLHVLFLDGAYHEGGAELVWNELCHLQTREVGGKRGGYRATDKPRRPSFRWVEDHAGRA